MKRADAFDMFIIICKKEFGGDSGTSGKIVDIYTCMRKSKGPSMQSCGIPDRTGSKEKD